MKTSSLKICLLFLLVMAALNSNAQKKEIAWFTSYERAVNLAKAENKLILLFFHGSDWCPPCIRMQHEVFSNDTFVNFSSSQLIFLDVDFPRRKQISEEQLKHNKELKKKFGLPEEFSQGYPQIVIINSSGEVLYQEKGYSGEGIGKLTGIINSIKN